MHDIKTTGVRAQPARPAQLIGEAASLSKRERLPVYGYQFRCVGTLHAFGMHGGDQRAARKAPAELDVAARHPEPAPLDARGQLVMPGNICGHTHFYGAFSRGMAVPASPSGSGRALGTPVTPDQIH